MSKFTFLSAAAVVAAASLLAPSGASADVYVYRPGPVIIAPPPLLPPAYYYTAPAAPVCTTRFVAVWINGVYTHRAVRACY